MALLNEQWLLLLKLVGLQVRVERESAEYWINRIVMSSFLWQRK